MTEEDATFFCIDFKPKSSTTSANISKESEPKESNEKIDSRHAEAELLLAIQEPKILEADASAKIEELQVEETKNVEESKMVVEEPDTTNKDQEENSTNKVIEKDEIKSDVLPFKDDDSKNISNINLNESRKSLRVKRLRTFTKEIVFDSPASSITYNLASVSKNSSLVIDPIVTTPNLPKKQKLTSSTETPKNFDSNSSPKKPDLNDSVNLDDSVFESASDANDQANRLNKKDSDTRKVQNFFKSLKLFKSSKKTMSSR
jgi:hypothetical protein